MKAVKRQATECENTIAVHMTDKEFISGIRKRQTAQKRSRPKTNRQFSKENKYPGVQ